MIPVAGSGAQSLGHFALEHQDHRADSIPPAQQVEQDRAAGIVGQVSDDLDSRSGRGHVSNVKYGGVSLVDLDPLVVLEAACVFGGKTLILLDQDQSAAGGRKIVRQCASPGPDLDHCVGRPDAKGLDHAIHDTATVQEMLAKRLARTTIRGGICIGIWLGFQLNSVESA
jgi:hypothetical protein